MQSFTDMTKFVGSIPRRHLHLPLRQHLSKFLFPSPSFVAPLELEPGRIACLFPPPIFE